MSAKRNIVAGRVNEDPNPDAAPAGDLYPAPNLALDLWIGVVEPWPVNRLGRAAPRPQNHKDVMAAALLSDSDDSYADLPRPRKRRLSDLICENH